MTGDGVITPDSGVLRQRADDKPQASDGASTGALSIPSVATVDRDAIVDIFRGGSTAFQSPDLEGPSRDHVMPTIGARVHTDQGDDGDDDDDDTMDPLHMSM